MLSGGPRPDPKGNLNQLLFETVERYHKPDALLFRVDGHWQPISHDTLLTRARHVALGLADLGQGPADRVAILSENRPEWAIADWGTLTAGQTNVPVYPTLTAAQTAYILRDAAVTAAFVSTRDQARKLASIRAELPALRHVVSFDPAAGVDLTLAQLEARGARGDGPEAAERWRRSALAVAPDTVATVIYTSGTTGEPKGVMLSHDNIASNVRAALASLLAYYHGEDVALSVLPLSHSFERMAGHFAVFATGTSIAYAESQDTIGRDLQEVRPTVVLAVPRLFEKIYARVQGTVQRAGAAQRLAFAWAASVATRWSEAELDRGGAGLLLEAQHRLAMATVFTAVGARPGGRLRYFVSGGAPLSAELGRFFHGVGLPILEGYGLTESSPVIAVNHPDDIVIGSVGRPLPGIEIRLADDGEVLTRGPHVMRGYLGMPDATREAVDADGWLHTGDIGRIERGHLFITDRKKDLIVTAGGKNIAPQPIESRVKQSRYVSQAVLLGDRRRFPVMLVVPDAEALAPLAREHGLPEGDRRALATSPEILAFLEAEVLTQLGGLARFELPKRIALLEEDLTLENGQLTPTLKVRRRVIEQRHAALLEKLYAEE
jgi:long-chain acyl-CoA synthetase